MRHSLTFVMLFAILGCGERVTIQPGEVGKELGTGGLEEEIRKPGAFRMDSCIIAACPKLVRLQTQKATKEFTIDKLFLPKSNVDMTKVSVGIQFQIRQDDASIETAYSEVRPVQANTVEGSEASSDLILLITSDMLYQTYVQRKAPDAIITALRSTKCCPEPPS